jgi:hypothetical protein
MEIRHMGHIDDLEPPVEELKLLGNPHVQDTDGEYYEVYLPLSRQLTGPEQDAAAQPAKSPAGWVHVHDDVQHLVVDQTTIESVGQHQDWFKKFVSTIATRGEEIRQQAFDAQRQKDDVASALDAERARRRDAAKTIKFD